MTLTGIMDTCVPSPNSINTTFSLSPHSIYEPERLGALFPCDLKMETNRSIEMCSSYEENPMLDDHFEDSSLKITPEMLSSMTVVTNSDGRSVSNTNSSELNKLNLVDSQICAISDQPLALGIDSEYLSDLLNNDSNDSKFSLPNFDLDLFPSNVPSTCQTPTPSSEMKPDYQENKYLKDVIFSSPSMTQEYIEQDFRQKRLVLKHQQFPPRKSEPPVGVVAPVKIKEEVESYPMTQAHLLQTDAIKVKGRGDKLGNELPPQIVPSFTQSEQVGCDSLILDPLDSGKKRQFTSTFVEDNLNEIKPIDFHLMSQIKRRRYDSGSSLLTSEDGDEYFDGFQPEYGSDDDNSDLDADLAHLKPGNCESLIEHGKKQKQYFWQYNVQAKGPKGTRLKLCVESPTDPHVLNGFEDPVFDEGNTIVAGIRHGGKARKGDGNEVAPNPLKLFKIGHQLLRLNKKINACQLGSDVPIQQRNEARREKNKLASRACRLKKKAQHEANKIKLHGLEIEHGQINNILRNMWPELRGKVKQLQTHANMKCDPNYSLTDKITSLIKSNIKNQVAGHTTDFVNQVIMNVEKNDLTGGLDIKARKT